MIETTIQNLLEINEVINQLLCFATLLKLAYLGINWGQPILTAQEKYKNNLSKGIWENQPQMLKFHTCFKSLITTGIEKLKFLALLMLEFYSLILFTAIIWEKPGGLMENQDHTTSGVSHC